MRMRMHLCQCGAVDSPPGDEKFHRTQLALVRRHEDESVLTRVVAMVPGLDGTEKMDDFDILTKPVRRTKAGKAITFAPLFGTADGNHALVECSYTTTVVIFLSKKPHSLKNTTDEQTYETKFATLEQ